MEEKCIFVKNDCAMDKMTREQRHHCMVANKSKGTKPELLLRRFLWKRGYRYRLNVRRLPGKPDIVLRRYRTAIFVNGCFWHGHDDCEYYREPKTNTIFWRAKISRNKERDELVRNQLKQMGWRTMVVWECQLKKDRLSATLTEIEHILNECLLKDVSLNGIGYHSQEECPNIAAEDRVGYKK